MTAAVPIPPGAKFPLGRVVITASAVAWLPADLIARSLARHAAGDWGDVTQEIARENHEALTCDRPFFSVYVKGGLSYMIVTTGTTRTTTVRMPRDWLDPPTPMSNPACMPAGVDLLPVTRPAK